jgi:hypothetical protein
MVGWNACADAEMIQAAQSAFGLLLLVSGAAISSRPLSLVSAGPRLACDESVSANPELCQGFQIALVSA